MPSTCSRPFYDRPSSFRYSIIKDARRTIPTPEAVVFAPGRCIYIHIYILSLYAALLLVLVDGGCKTYFALHFTVIIVSCERSIWVFFTI